MKKVFVGGNVMSGKTVVRQLLDGHPNVFCNHLHDLLGTFIFSDTAKQFFLRKRLANYLSIQENFPCIKIRYNSEETALVDIGDFFSALYRFSNYRILHKYAEGKILYVQAKEDEWETSPFVFDFTGFEKVLKEELFSGQRVFSAEEVVDVIYSSYEMNYQNKHYHDKDYWFVNTLHNGIEPILAIVNNIPEAKILVMDRDLASLVFTNTVRIRSYLQAGRIVDNSFRRVLFGQNQFIKKIKTFRTELAELQRCCDNIFIVSFERMMFDTESIMREISRFLDIEYTDILSKPSLSGTELSDTKYPMIGTINDDPNQMLCQSDIDLLHYECHGFGKQNTMFERCSLLVRDFRWRKMVKMQSWLAVKLEELLPAVLFFRLKKISRKIRF